MTRKLVRSWESLDIRNNNGPIATEWPNFDDYYTRAEVDYIIASLPTEGVLIQAKRVVTNTYASTTNIIPLDDTIPQISEGSNLVTRTITPTSSSNQLIILFHMLASASVSAFITAALFRDTNADAILAQSHYMDSPTGFAPIQFNYAYVPGSTNEITFRVRYGLNVAGTAYSNGRPSGRMFGGVARASLLVLETLP